MQSLRPGRYGTNPPDCVCAHPDGISVRNQPGVTVGVEIAVGCACSRCITCILTGRGPSPEWSNHSDPSANDSVALAKEIASTRNRFEDRRAAACGIFDPTSVIPSLGAPVRWFLKLPHISNEAGARQLQSAVRVHTWRNHGMMGEFFRPT